MTDLQTLHTKYRPTTFDDFLGNGPTIDSLIDVLEQDRCHSFILVGDSGCGKTTLARIIANELLCDAHNITEINASANTGIDDMRALIESSMYQTIGKSATRVIIVDEVQGLSKQGWNSLLKPVEEPPAWVYWIFCTTEPSKIPKTISTRCATYTLRPPSSAELEQYLTQIAEKEKLKLVDDAIFKIVREHGSSVRSALVMLGMADGAGPKELAQLLQRPNQDVDVLAFCQLMASPRGRSWEKAVTVLAQLKELNHDPETIRIMMVNYISAILLNPKSKPDTHDLLMVLDAFSAEYARTDKYGPLLLSTANVVFNAEGG